MPNPSQLWTYKRVAGTNPGANTEVSETVPAGKAYQLVMVFIQMVQGATQTPQPILQIDDGTNVVAEIFGSTTAQAVSTTCGYTWAINLPLSGQIGATTNVRSTAPLPDDLILPAGYRIKTVTLGLGANSDYGTPSLYVIEFTL